MSGFFLMGGGVLSFFCVSCVFNPKQKFVAKLPNVLANLSWKI